MNQEQVKIAVVGSRSYIYRAYLFTTLDSFIFTYFWDDGLTQSIEIVSGGAYGADLLAKEYALEHVKNGIKYKEFAPKKYSADELFARNVQIADYADFCLAFINKPLHKSKGTNHVINCFINLNKKVFLFHH